MSKKFSRAGYQHDQQARAKESNELFEVELPSGWVFTLRKPDLAVFVASGALPQAVGEKMNRSKSQGASDEDAFNALSPKEKETGFKFGKKLLKQICVHPRIVDDPQDDDEIAMEELSEADLLFLFRWGGGGEDLDSFRGERQQPASSGADGKKQQRAGKQSA